MRALIVLGGDAPGRQLLLARRASCDLLIAADRGLEALDAAGIAPDLIVGDMDSVDPQVLARYEGKVGEHRLCTVKDDTDGVDALDLAIGRGATHVTLLGALGGRMDHALANLMLLVRAHRRGIWTQIVSERMHIVRVDGEYTLSHAVGDTVSLLPLGTARGVTLSGFFYPLTDATLSSDYPLGVSNVVVRDAAHVRVREGDLLLFHVL